MKVYVITSEYWNGEYDVRSVAWVMASKEAAEARVESLNEFAKSAYSTRYEVEEMELEQ